MGEFLDPGRQADTNKIGFCGPSGGCNSMMCSQSAIRRLSWAKKSLQAASGRHVSSQRQALLRFSNHVAWVRVRPASPTAHRPPKKHAPWQQVVDLIFSLTRVEIDKDALFLQHLSGMFGFDFNREEWFRFCWQCCVTFLMHKLTDNPNTLKARCPPEQCAKWKSSLHESETWVSLPGLDHPLEDTPCIMDGWVQCLPDWHLGSYQPNTSLEDFAGPHERQWWIFLNLSSNHSGWVICHRRNQKNCYRSHPGTVHQRCMQLEPAGKIRLASSKLATESNQWNAQMDLWELDAEAMLRLWRMMYENPGAGSTPWGHDGLSPWCANPTSWWQNQETCSDAQRHNFEAINSWYGQDMLYVHCRLPESYFQSAWSSGTLWEAPLDSIN